MSEQIPDAEPTGGRRAERGTRRSGRGLKSCLAVLVALAVVVGGFYFAVTKGVELDRGPVLLQCRGLRRPRARAR